MTATGRRLAAVEAAVREAVAWLESGHVTRGVVTLRAAVACADRPPPPVEDGGGVWPEHPRGEA